MNKIQILFNNTEINNKDCCIIINCFSNWNNNSNNINSLIYLNYIRNKSDSCVIFVKNNFLNLDNANKEKDINEFIIILKDNENFNSKISKINNFNEIEDYEFGGYERVFSINLENKSIQIFTNV